MTAVAPAPSAEVARAAAPAAPARLAAVLAVVVALVGAVLGPSGGLDELFAPATAIVGSGTVERLDGTDWVAVPAGGRVPDGATVRAPDGEAELLVPGAVVALAAGTELVVDDPWRVRAGTVVVDGAPFALDLGGARADGEGTWRWDATGRLAAYAGSVVATDATGREALVRGLEQVPVRDALVTEDPRPYAYAADDAFDQRHLADAIGVDDYLAALRRGLAGEYGSAPQPPAFYTDFDGLDGALVAALGDVGFDREGDRVGPPADVLLAAVVTDALVTDAALAPQEAADRARTLRLAGATWGVVAQRHDLDAGDVRAAADRALLRRQQAEEAGTAVPAVPATAPVEDEPAEPAGGTAGGPATPAPGQAPDGGGATPPAGDRPDQPAPGPGDDGDDGGGEDGLLGSVVEDSGVGDAVDGLAGDEVGGLVDDLVDAGDDLLDGPGDGAGAGASDDGAGSSRGGGLLDTTGEVVGDTVDTVEDTVDAVEGTVGSLLGN